MIRLPKNEIADISTVAYQVDAYANAVDDVRKLLAHIEALEAENAGLYGHLHGVHHCNCDLTARSGGGVKDGT